MTLPNFRTVVPWLLGGVAVICLTILTAFLYIDTDPEVVYTVRPDRIAVGDVNVEYVELSGQQCFSSTRVRTDTTEAWRFENGAAFAPPTFQPLYRAQFLSTQYGEPAGLPLDSDGCNTFSAFRQPVPLELRQDLLNDCSLEPEMYVEIRAEAVDLDTDRVSTPIVWRSDPFEFPNRC